MKHVGKIIRMCRENPPFIFMRAVSRFPWVRAFVRCCRALVLVVKTRNRRRELEKHLGESVFVGIDYKKVVTELKSNGVAFGLQLPAQSVESLRRYAEKAVVYADREPDKGFLLKDKATAESVLGKNILVAQYLNAESGCEFVSGLRRDPLLEIVALEYLGSVPRHVGTNMWWTFPVDASEEDRARHAHVYHYDLDDFSFLKFFFYLTDVESRDGAHVCVAASHIEKPHKRIRDHFLVRRYSDSEINTFYPEDQILKISGSAGTGFAEDTLCIHKGATPTQNPRLLLQFQFALFDYGVQRDEVPEDRLALIA